MSIVVLLCRPSLSRANARPTQILNQSSPSQQNTPQHNNPAQNSKQQQENKEEKLVLLFRDTLGSVVGHSIGILFEHFNFHGSVPQLRQNTPSYERISVERLFKKISLDVVLDLLVRFFKQWIMQSIHIKFCLIRTVSR